MFALSQSSAYEALGSDRAPTAARNGIKSRVPMFDEHRAIVAAAHEQRAALLGSLIGEAVGALSNRIVKSMKRRAALAELDALDDRMLADIGVSRGELYAVAANENERRRSA